MPCSTAARFWPPPPLGLGATFASAQEPKSKKRLAVVTTLWNYRSHAWHMAERFLHGYPREGKWHRPPLEVVCAYVDQRPEGDLSGKRSEEFGFTIYPTVAEALRCGGDKLAVDAVLLIGEHGDYPDQRDRPEAISAVRAVLADRQGLPGGRPHDARLQRQAPLVEVRVGQGDGRDGPRA